MRQPGQSLSEYAIALALIAIVAVSALTMFGGSLSGTFDRIVAMLGGGGGSGGSSGGSGAQNGTLSLLSPSSGGPVGSLGAPTAGISYESAGGGSSSNATSVEGSAAKVSQQLRDLADNWTSSDGQPMDGALQVKIRDLAIRGENIARMQEAALINAGDTQANLQGLTDKAGEYIQEHQDVMAAINTLAASNPDYKELGQLISTYSGTITAVNAQNFIAENGQGMNTSQYVIGTPPADVATVTKDESPIVTDVTADKIEATTGSTPP